METITQRPTSGYSKNYKAEYTAYANARQRCNDPNCKPYVDYGGRGIKFLYKSFYEFLRDVGERPEGKLENGYSIYTLERINNDGNYEPGNCKWATWAEQAANKRNSNVSKLMPVGALLEPEIYALLKEECEQNGVTVTDFVRNLIISNIKSLTG